MTTALAICIAAALTSLPGTLSVKKFPTATRPPPPPPAPPLVVFDQPQSGQAEAPPPQARFEYFELIAPSQNGQNFNPTLSISNPDFNVVYRPRQPTQAQQQQPQRPQPQRPQPQPQRPAQQFQQPQRPTQRPQQQFQQRPQRPNSQVLSAPPRGRPPPRGQFPPNPGHRFSPQAFNQQSQQTV